MLLLHWGVAPAAEDGGVDNAEPSQAALVFSQVLGLSQKGNFGEARRAVGAWSKEDAEVPEARVRELLGMVETYAKKHEAAQKHFERWCELEPASHVARFNMAESLFLQRKFERAVIHFATAEALARSGDALDVVELARFKRIVSFLADSKVDEAKKLFEEFAWRDGSPGSRLVEAAFLHQSGNPVRAGEILRECGELFPPELNDLYVDSFLELGWVSQREGGPPLFRSEP